MNKNSNNTSSNFSNETKIEFEVIEKNIKVEFDIQKSIKPEVPLNNKLELNNFLKRLIYYFKINLGTRINNEMLINTLNRIQLPLYLCILAYVIALGPIFIFIYLLNKIDTICLKYSKRF